MTGLANRRAFDQIVDDVLKTSRKSELLLYALIDIDFFKSVNDNLGHPAGDAVLIEVASRLKSFAGADIKIGRYGGEEFAILLQQNLRGSAQQIDRLRLSIAAAPVMYEDQEVRITVSCVCGRDKERRKNWQFVWPLRRSSLCSENRRRNRVFLHNGDICEPFGNPGEQKSLDFKKSRNPDRIRSSCERCTGIQPQEAASEI